MDELYANMNGMAIEPKVHQYFSSSGVVALTTAPLLVNHCLGGYGSDDPVWDYRPSEERFNLREAMAHLADWNEIFEGPPKA